MQQELNKELAVIRSAVSADYVVCPRGEALLRNVGQEPVVVFRIIVLKNGEVTWDSFQVHGIKRIATIEVGEVTNPPIRFACPAADLDKDIVTVQIHYIPLSLFNPTSPELIDPTSDVHLFRISAFRAEELELIQAGKLCPDALPNWIWMDYIDPEDYPPDGWLGQKIGLILPEASKLFSADLEIEVETPLGKVKVVHPVVSISEQTQWISIDMSNLKYPARISLQVISPSDAMIFQQMWYLYGDENSYVNYVKLLWNRLDEKLVGAYVSVFHRIAGTYKVSVKVFDCFDKLVSSGFSVKDVVPGAAGRWEEYIISFSSTDIMSNIRRIEVYVEDLSEVVTVTHTKTFTVMETVTETSTSWITIPAKTVTKTETTTTTRTTTLPATTLTSTITRTSTSTTISTTTSSVTRTTYSPTVTSTTYVTATSTTTRFLTTVTITSTTTITSSSTSFTTRTTTATTSIPTTTSTITSTSIVTTTVPTATTTSTISQTVTTTSTPPPVTQTTTVTATSTVATTRITTTTTVGTTVTLTTTKRVTITWCPTTQSSPSYADFLYIVGATVPVFLTSMVIRRWRK